MQGQRRYFGTATLPTELCGLLSTFLRTRAQIMGPQFVDWLSLRSKPRRYQLLRGLAGPSYSEGLPKRLLSTCQHFDLPNTLVSLSSHLYLVSRLVLWAFCTAFNYGVSLVGGFALPSCLCEDCYVSLHWASISFVYLYSRSGKACFLCSFRRCG